jgi:prevent-host-death family protein
MAMKQISVQALKARLSGAIAEAEAGRTLVITRHGEPVAQVSPVRPAGVHRGSKSGTGAITPAVTHGTKGRYLTVLLDDRGTW